MGDVHTKNVVVGGGDGNEGSLLSRTGLACGPTNDSRPLPVAPELKASPLLVRTVTYTLQDGDVHAPGEAHAPLDIGSRNKDARALPVERRPPLPVSVHG